MAGETRDKVIWNEFSMWKTIEFSNFIETFVDLNILLSEEFENLKTVLKISNLNVILSLERQKIRIS